MSALKYAVITPSFRGDFERCRLLVESAARWLAPTVNHYIVVDRQDLELFKPFENQRTKVLVVEELLPFKIFRLPGVPRLWWSFRFRPVRNWILQQIVKLSMARNLTEDVLLFVDSDTFFCAPYDPAQLERDGKVPLFVQIGQAGLLDFNDPWHSVAARLLGLPIETPYDTNFIGNVICWRREEALKLADHLEKRAGGSMMGLLARQHVFSEYILYGLFATRVRGEASGHWHDPLERTHCDWGVQPLDAAALEKFKAQAAPHHHSVMISAKSHTSVAAIRDAFFAS